MHVLLSRGDELCREPYVCCTLSLYGSASRIQAQYSCADSPYSVLRAVNREDFRKMCVESHVRVLSC